MQKYGIIGNPVDHSLSPVMYQAGYRVLGIDAIYNKINVQVGELNSSVKKMIDSGYNGWNVTYPFKEEIIPLLDEISDEARAIGAVNTVKAESGRIKGYNTDGSGFVASLEEAGFSLENKNAVILGAGGAAKAIAVALAKKNVHLLILNRTLEKAHKIVNIVNGFGAKAECGLLEKGYWLENSDIIIQTTSIELTGGRFPFFLEGISQEALVVDIIYNPWETSFLAEARLGGCKTMNGLNMLLFQGIEAWKIWFGREAPSEVMKKALLSRLGYK